MHKKMASVQRKVAGEMPFANLEEIQKEVSKIFDQMRTLQEKMETTEHMLAEKGMPNMSEEVGGLAEAIGKSVKYLQEKFPHLIPFE